MVGTLPVAPVQLPIFRNRTYIRFTNLDNRLNYSTDEHIVGKWIDGRDIYEKTVEFTPTSRSYTYTHNIENSMIISASLIAYNGQIWFTLPNAYVPDISNWGISCIVNTNSIEINTGTKTTIPKNIYCTIRYLK